MRKKNVFKSVLALVVVIVLCLQSGIINAAAADSTPSVRYSLHVQDKGWMNYVRDGSTGGTTGKSLRAEAIKIQISGMSGGITYRTHIQDIGWTSWSSNNKQSGTIGRGLQMEAIQIKLTGKIAAEYDIYYRVHLADAGWLGWTKNGNTAGSTGCSIQMEAIQIKLSPKTKPLQTSQSTISKPTLKVKAHVQNEGWQNPVGENQTAGSTGKKYRMEALQIECSDFFGGSGIQYRVHMQDDGWQGWKTSGKTAGSTGKSKRIEAVQVKLTGLLSNVYDIYYRVHCADYGWLGWACNGESAGTTGGSKQMEAIQIKLVRKNTTVNRGGAAFYDLSAPTSSGSPFQGKMTASQLQSKFPNGKYWNHAGNPGAFSSMNNQDGYTSTPCSRHGTVGTKNQTCNGFAPYGTQLSWQCMGYAEKLGYDFTGYNPRNNANGWTTSYSSSALNSLKPGDIVRYKKDCHSIFVTGVSGNTVTYTDCNSDNHCKIRWGATISKSTLKSTFTYIRIAPYQIQ